MLHQNQISRISRRFSRLWNGGNSSNLVLTMQGNPSQCLSAIPIVESNRNATQIICDCAPTYYGASFCEPIYEFFDALPPVLSARMGSVHLHNSWHNRTQITSQAVSKLDRNCQTPWMNSVQLLLPSNSDNNSSNSNSNSNSNSTNNTFLQQVSYPIVYSVWNWKNSKKPHWGFTTNVWNLPYTINAYNNGTKLFLDDTFLNRFTPADVSLYINITLPNGLEFNQTDGRIFGTPAGSAGRFSIPVWGKEQFSQEQAPLQLFEVVLDVTCDNQHTCNGQGTCLQPIAESPYYKCECKGDYEGLNCENQIPLQTINKPISNIAIGEMFLGAFVFLAIVSALSIALYKQTVIHNQRMKSVHVFIR